MILFNSVLGSSVLAIPWAIAQVLDGDWPYLPHSPHAPPSPVVRGCTMQTGWALGLANLAVCGLLTQLGATMLVGRARGRGGRGMATVVHPRS